MKKFSWIFALILALSMAFVFAGCGEDDPGTEGLVFVPKMTWALGSSLSGNATSDFNTVQTILNGEGLDIAGNNTHVAVEIKGDGSIVVKTIADWGAGIDLMDSEFGFKQGDVIAVEGKLLGGSPSQIYINTNTKGEQATKADPNPTKGKTFTIKRTLSADDITKIAAGEPQAVRISAKADGITFQITAISVTGKR